MLAFLELNPGCYWCLLWHWCRQQQWQQSKSTGWLDSTSCM